MTSHFYNDIMCYIHTAGHLHSSKKSSIEQHVCIDKNNFLSVLFVVLWRGCLMFLLPEPPSLLCSDERDLQLCVLNLFKKLKIKLSCIRRKHQHKNNYNKHPNNQLRKACKCLEYFPDVMKMSVAFSPVQSVPSSIHKERNISHFHKPYACWLQVSHFHKPYAGLCRLHILCAVSNFFSEILKLLHLFAAG